MVNGPAKAIRDKKGEGILNNSFHELIS